MDDTTLEKGELHPMTSNALDYIKQNMTFMDLESIASNALSGNRTANICFGTYKRLEQGEPVSDRYLLGLAWFIKELRDHKYDDEDEIREFKERMIQELE